MTSPGCCKLKCPYCDGHMEVPSELVGEWTICPHCQKEIPLDTPTDLPPGFKPKDERGVPSNAKQEGQKKKLSPYLWLLPIVVVVPVLVYLMTLALASDNNVLKTLGFAVPGLAGAAITAILFALALFWAVCLFLLPIIVYFIYRTVLKIEQNTRPK